MRSIADILKFVSKDTIYEKLDINKVNLITSFPKKYNIDSMENYLLENGYNKIDIPTGRFQEYIEAFNDYKGKSFMTEEKWIRFADTTKFKIDDNNPIIVLWMSDDNGPEFSKEVTNPWQYDISINQFELYMMKTYKMIK